MAGKHTPGPWVWIEPRRVLNSAHGKVIDHAYYEGMWFARHDDAEDEANARLIAAAPDLLEALEKIQHLNGNDYFDGGVCAMRAIAEAAIARATQPLPPPNEE